MPDVLAAAVEPRILDELGPLELWTTTVRVDRAAAKAGRARLGRLSWQFRAAERIRAHAGRLLDPAYLTFERQVGLDPTAPPTVLERDAREVVVTGQLMPSHPVADVRLAIIAEVGLPLMALDAARTSGPWTLRTVGAGETYRGGGATAPGDLVVADAVGPVAPVVGDPPGALAAGPKAREVVLYAVRVPGIASWEVSEAVWRAATYLTGT